MQKIHHLRLAKPYHTTPQKVVLQLRETHYEELQDLKVVLQLRDNEFKVTMLD